MSYYTAYNNSRDHKVIAGPHCVLNHDDISASESKIIPFEREQWW